MPVKIVLYAEDISVGTEIVNFALKVGGALSVYDPNVDAPLGSNGTAPELPRRGPVRALRLSDGHAPFRGTATIKEQAYKALRREFGGGEFTLKQANDALAAADWDEAQATSAVHGLRKTKHLVALT